MLLAVNFEGKNIFYRKWNVIWTISFKITAEIEIRKHMFCLTSQNELYRLCWVNVLSLR